MRCTGLLLLTLALSACPSIETTDGGVITVGPDGTKGILIDTAHGVGLEIPKGALTEETVITITVIDTGIPEVPMRKRISYGYRISPSSLKFASPIKLYLPWVEERLVSGVDPGTYDMRRQTTSDPYLALPGTATHSELKTVEAQTDRLGLFWLTSPNDPSIGSLTIDPTEAFINVGESQQFKAEVKDQTGAPIAVDVHWSALAPRIGTVTDGNDGGFYQSKDPGTATVTVRAGSVAAVAKVHVKGSTVGPSTFVHENPFPTGNDLWGGTSGALGTAFVGANGTVLVRDGTGKFNRVFSTPGVVFKGIAGTSLTNATAVGTYGTAGVLLELSGAAPKLTTFTNVNPEHLWFDGTYGIAAGTGNEVLIRKDGKWGTQYNPTFEPIRAVVGDGAGGYLVLGGQGSIYVWDPATQRWNSRFDQTLNLLLEAGAFVSADGREAWAYGANKLWHFQNDQWTSQNPPATPVMEATTLGLVDGRVVIGGKVNKAGWVTIYDPAAVAPTDGGASAAWVVMQLRGPQLPRGFFGDGILSTVGWLVGDYGAVWHYAGGTLVEDSHGFYGDVAAVVTVGSEVFAGVNECANSNCTAFTPAVYQRDAQGVFSLVGGAQPFGGKIWALAARSKTDVVAAVVLADGSAPQVWFYDGNQWSAAVVMGGFGGGTLLQLRYCGSTLFGVGLGGSWYRGGPTLLTRQTALGMDTLWSIACPTDTELWSAGTGALFSRVGSASWVARNTMGIEHPDYRAVWSPGQGESFQFGDARFGTYWNTAELSLIDSPGGTLPDVINGIWGSSVDNLYAVGVSQAVPVVFGLGVRFDGSDWRQVDMGSQRAVTAIDGTTNTNAFIGTRGGGVLRGVVPP
ncbi:MAG: Ig-like domain-containing protein [Archangiaceae bacterium]|nr:Ig-like domain-containing protein [Archangiaceae bacterium]